MRDARIRTFELVFVKKTKPQTQKINMHITQIIWIELSCEGILLLTLSCHKDTGISYPFYV